MNDYVDDDILIARVYERASREKKNASPEQLMKRYWNNMNSRVKTKSYNSKGIRVLWTYSEFVSWWSTNENKMKMIQAEGLTPSIDRIDSKRHYGASNCRWLPVEVNRSLGEVESLIVRMKTLQKFLTENKKWLE